MISPDRPAAAILEGSWSRLLPWLALFARCAIGLCLLNIGLVVVLASGQGGASPPGDIMGMLLWGIVQAIPYVAIAVGLGLVFGIFTTFNALLTCALALVVPIVVLASLIVQSAVGMGGPGFGRNPMMMFGPDFGFGLIMISYAILVMPSLAILVLLSPMQINKYSLDTLMFSKPRRPLSPPTPSTGPQFGEEPILADDREKGTSQ